MWNAFRDVLVELAGSKKFLVFVATAIALGAAKLGWNVSESTVEQFVALVVAYLVGQGIADHGKEAAKQSAIIDAKRSSEGGPTTASKIAA